MLKFLAGNARYLHGFLWGLYNLSFNSCISPSFPPSFDVSLGSILNPRLFLFSIKYFCSLLIIPWWSQNWNIDRDRLLSFKEHVSSPHEVICDIVYGLLPQLEVVLMSLRLCFRETTLVVDILQLATLAFVDRGVAMIELKAVFTHDVQHRETNLGAFLLWVAWYLEYIMKNIGKVNCTS